MPILPSGLTLGIGSHAIPEDVGTNWFKCPEGHFWYQRPDEAITPPPYDEDSSYLSDWLHAPVPVDTVNVKHYVYVLYRRDDGRFVWRGEWLNQFPRFIEMDEADLSAWNDWLRGEQCQGYLRKVIELCRKQAELNKRCNGLATFTTRPQPAPRDDQ